MKRVLLLVALAAVGCASGEKHTKLTMAQTPVPVRQGIEKAFPDARIKEIEKEVYEDGVVHYEVELVTKDGKTREIELTPDGEVLEPH